MIKKAIQAWQNYHLARLFPETILQKEEKQEKKTYDQNQDQIQKD